MLTEINKVDILEAGLDGGKIKLTWMQNVICERSMEKSEVWKPATVLRQAQLFSWRRIKDKERLWLRRMDRERMKEWKKKNRRKTVHHTICHDQDPFDCYYHCTEILEMSRHSNLLTNRISQNKECKLKLKVKNAPFLFCFVFWFAGLMS